MTLSFIKPLIKRDEGILYIHIYKKNHPVITKQVINIVDLGYAEIEKYFLEQLSAIPYKKRYQDDLSKEEKENNKILLNKKRIIVEHTICRLK